MKHQFFSVRYNKSQQNIDEYVQAFMLRRIVKPKFMYFFMLKTVKKYFMENYLKFKMRT
jgi:hypothetical protein